MECLITNGKQYIRLDSNGTPQTCGQVLADKFTEDKARNIIRNLPKPMRKFHFNVQLIPEINTPVKQVEEEKLPDDINDVLTELDDYYEDYQRNPKYDNPYTYHGETSLEKEMSVNHVDIGNFFKMVIECVSDREAYIENMEYLIKEYDLTPSSFDKWVKQARTTGSFKTVDNLTDEQRELIELRKRNKELEMQLDILKQAAVIMARKGK